MKRLQWKTAKRTNILEVLAAGPQCHFAKVGDTVMVDPRTEAARTEIDGKFYLIVSEHQIIREVVKGSVTISLEDYHSLIDHAISFKTKEENLTQAAKELQVFLSFLCTRENIEKYVEEFNKQSNTSRIIIEGSYAKIELKNDKKIIKEV